ncbi:efflux RND transporter periplasmic adaptor subunit [Rhodospirillum rubrum]|uniref:Secretion protein HlyD n=1 Tax=Rhodospirillum rubrum (strain ATCC 11170 / ATH 1.1.1 / DSM 467 / LMG 4362 / NCIMB 8255 / S1) TaxID=269796 RepID=Q2RW07_RHORT|nr:efflux RND transporter periplasmic adaptor subunit [Rhodospirillum rubrum]ABC21688.1 Secretion protein HlyD [Rhodospirillum rubrum ATCC 11170]AEO47386.1 secretion protein HlyD [Rhodospirillum rubrum F11]MBK5953240.1 MexE family multidrug efflux RND transporter periplasmic adaptor subunit [Rhodospirillum rubrum]QXG81350.1 efflux RND transporter periplasmic adaptor subunit [Rhodospirillum rubrum]HAQ01372.1 MexE family multidrug efflux RND transporter periplasmic adaptor subunit [Rhodospirillu
MTKGSRFVKGRAVLLGTVGLILLAGGVGVVLDRGVGVPAQAQAPAQAPRVGVQTLTPRQVQVWSSFSGRLRAVDLAEIRPEVGGRLTEVRFRDGQTVAVGDVLFVIDPAPYEAAMAKAEASLTSARTNAAFARTELNRAVSLVKTQTIAQRLYDERANANRLAQAAVLVAEAEVKRARIDLDHTRVKAPIAGRVSRAEITVGNVVQPGAGAPLLTSIVSNDGLYADFEVDEQTYMSGIRARGPSRDQENRIPVQITAQGDEAHPYGGTIHSFDNRIDSATGTIRARALLANEDGALMPGMFVSVKVASGGGAGALMVQERAIGNDQSKKFVYVVGEDAKVAYREVDLGARVEGERIVLSGLRAGERVIVDGLQQVRPTMTVEIKEAGLETASRALAAK